VAKASNQLENLVKSGNAVIGGIGISYNQAWRQ